METLGWFSAAESRKLSVAAWRLLYQQIENLLQAKLSCIVESNFDPKYANERWRLLAQNHTFDLIQVRCETDVDTTLARYKRRIEDGMRHPGHIDSSQDADFLAAIKNPMEWVAVGSKNISFDTTNPRDTDYIQLVEFIRQNSR